MERVIENAVESVRLMHGAEIENMDEFTQVARMYLDCIDKEGFVFDFDLAWRAAGYSRKDAAKRVLLRAPFIEGQHYTITTTTNLQRENTGVHFPPIGEVILQGPETRVGRPSESIKLTAIGMGQFCLSAQTERGRMLRDFVMQLTLGFKRFAAAVQAGEIEVRRVSTEQEARGSKRLKVCESQKHLMQAAHGHEGLNAGVYARINGVTNKVVTGRYKHELARELGKPPASVNARNYMDRAQLCAVELLEEISAGRMRGSPDADPLVVHTDAAKHFEDTFKILHSSTIPEQCSLRSVRNQAAIQDRAAAAVPVAVAVDAPAIADAPRLEPVRQKTTITTYFQRRV
jgi:hypothetical protein